MKENNFVNKQFAHVHGAIEKNVEKKQKEEFLMHNGENLTRSLSSWIEKLTFRGNFSFEIGKPLSYDEMAEKFPENVWHLNENGVSEYGDEDMMFPVRFSSWDTATGDSERNIEINGFFPVHITYNGAPSFGWSKNNGDTPDNCLQFVFWKEDKGFELPYSRVRDIINFGEDRDNSLRMSLEKYLWEIFLRAHFCSSEKIPQEDNR